MPEKSGDTWRGSSFPCQRLPLQWSSRFFRCPISFMLLPVALLSALPRQDSLGSRFPRTLPPHCVRTDGVGRKVRVPEFPRRIVSLAPSVTETLFALGSGDRVVGVTQFCDYPPEARTRPRVGGMVNPSWEAILALRPDLLV